MPDVNVNELLLDCLSATKVHLATLGAVKARADIDLQERELNDLNDVLTGLEITISKLDLMRETLGVPRRRERKRR